LYALNTYQADAWDFAKQTSSHEHDLNHWAFGACEEAGEVAGVMKRLLRGDIDLEAARERMLPELGDLLWYLAATAQEIGLTLEEVARVNINKLSDRRERNVLQGSGDNR
jgi:NTP pyrophosphatase (non-canonical NTP hydrolase)